MKGACALRVGAFSAFGRKGRMARVTNGRLIRPSNLAERRLLLSLGLVVLQVPRGTNPYVIARRLERAARRDCEDLVLLRDLVRRRLLPAGRVVSS
jgi:hypothetical protein